MKSCNYSKPKQILTHINSSHAKPDIFEGEKNQHPKASTKYANGEKPGKEVSK